MSEVATTKDKANVPPVRLVAGPGVVAPPTLDLRKPPHDIDLEQQVLGAALLKNAHFASASAFLQTDHFFDPLHRRIWTIIGAVIARGLTADPLTIGTYFERDEPIHANQTVRQYLGHLVANVATTMYVGDYARALVELHARRMLIVIGEDLVGAAYNAPPEFSPLAQSEEAAKRIASVVGDLAPAHAGDLEFASDLGDLDEVDDDIVKNLIPRGSLGVLYGPSGAGKSFVMLHMAYAIAHGRPFVGRRTCQGAVLYIALEGQRRFRRRVMAATMTYGCPSKRFARCTFNVALGTAPGAQESVSKIIALAKQQADAAGVPVLLIVIDTYHRAIAGANENDSDVVSAVMTQAGRISQETGATVFFVHHPGKDVDRGMRGSNSLEAAVDTVLAIEQETDSKIATLSRKKVKDDERGPLATYSLRRVVIAQDDEGEDITSCIVEFSEPSDRTDRPRGPAPHSAAGLALNELHHVIIAGSAHPSRGHSRIPDGVMLVARDAWRAACLTRQLGEGGPDSQERAFRRAAKSLEAGGYVGAYGDYVWPIQKRSGSGGQRTPDTRPHPPDVRCPRTDPDTPSDPPFDKSDS